MHVALCRVEKADQSVINYCAMTTCHAIFLIKPELSVIGHDHTIFLTSGKTNTGEDEFQPHKVKAVIIPW